MSFTSQAFQGDHETTVCAYYIQCMVNFHVDISRILKTAKIFVVLVFATCDSVASTDHLGKFIHCKFKHFTVVHIWLKVVSDPLKNLPGKHAPGPH